MHNIFNFIAISTKHLFTKREIAVVSVINDLATDSRVQKTCDVLMECGYDVILIGRKLPGSLPLPGWPYRAVRMNLLFRQGPAFYFFFNLRLFLKLLFTKADLLFANDLDTLWPNYIVARWKNVPLVYDSHELFCEVPELLDHPVKRRIWKGIEGRVVPRLKYCITVNESIASIFEKEYGVRFSVIRNIPPPPEKFRPKSRKELGLPEEKKIVLLQGAGINIQRGAEELSEAMQYVEGALLLIIGSGDVWPALEEKAKDARLSGKVKLIKKIPRGELLHYTCNADLGISIDKNTNPNYYNSLPNKVFDYLQAGVPILATPLPEIKKIVEQYNVGWFIESHDPKHIAEKIKSALSSPDYAQMKANTLLAAEDNSWGKEKQKYLQFISAIRNKLPY